jgi:hypothetical protein
VSSVSGVPCPAARARLGRQLAYWGCAPVGASIVSESAPPERKIDTRMRSDAGACAAAAAMPCSNAFGPRLAAPYTDSASPVACETNERRVSPVPAGIGIPGSTAGRPWPAWAAARRRSWVRE